MGRGGVGESRGPLFLYVFAIDADTLARALAVLRIFFGVILFSNGLAKLFSFSAIDIGPYSANLIDRGITQSILRVNGMKTEVPLIGTIANDLLLPNYAFFQWVITATELGIGALLILGLATRGAALAGLGMQIFLALLYFSSNRWVFELSAHRETPAFGQPPNRAIRGALRRRSA